MDGSSACQSELLIAADPRKNLRSGLMYRKLFTIVPLGVIKGVWPFSGCGVLRTFWLSIRNLSDK
ncbi:MAG: hypothetical protein DRP65_04015 [Planctomycetota bacterium]|nr:MAG: hypothetical protein DRP65_04015 [Planctomycetota bacterium]